MSRIIPLSIALLALSACSDMPLAAHYNRGAPESLLDMSSEVTTVSLNSSASIDELTSWISQDQPTRAELSCASASTLCSRAEDVLQQFGVPVTQGAAPADGGYANSVALVYERVVARDCENRYIDNSINPYNLNHPSFGCSTAVNMVQMIGDKRQFTSPALLDFVDGEKAVQNVNDYYKPTVATPASQSMTGSGASSSNKQQGGGNNSGE